MFQGLFQPMHLVVVLLIALIVFGPGKISGIGDSLGKAIKGFKKAMDEPENYENLVVRVSGFSAHYTKLGRRVQQDIISRTEHALSAR